MSRRKSETFDLPADAAEAEQMIGEYVDIERDRLLEELAADEAIAGIKQGLAERRRELSAQAKPLFEGLKAWFEAGGKDEIARGRRSAELGAAVIGIRKTPPSLKTERKVTFADVFSWLSGLRWGRRKDFIRVKRELDKEAISKAMRDDPEVAEVFAGRLKIEQTDEFFIDTGLDAETLRKDKAAS
ncbi:MAG: host-nuclease inhibitor Gam family protein [Pseudomonadota bacterium]